MKDGAAIVATVVVVFVIYLVGAQLHVWPSVFN